MARATCLEDDTCVFFVAGAAGDVGVFLCLACAVLLYKHKGLSVTLPSVSFQLCWWFKTAEHSVSVGLQFPKLSSVVHFVLDCTKEKCPEIC